MGTVNLGWFDSRHKLYDIEPAQIDLGWPQCLSSSDLAILQRPMPQGLKGPQVGFFAMGSLSNLATAISTTCAVSHVNEKSVKFHSAHEFADWLASNREQPSQQIQAWFDAVSVAGAGQTDAPTATTPDYKLLATSDQLLEAFGQLGLKPTWFKDLKGHQWLFDARRIKGQGQKSHTIPAMFCPYAVMIGLVKKVRKPILADTGWRILQHKFSAVYAEFENHDPRDWKG